MAILLSLLLFGTQCLTCNARNQKFDIKNDRFILDGKPFRILSGRSARFPDLVINTVEKHLLL